MIYIGIDNGLSGALVALSAHSGLRPIAMLVMPLQAKAKGNEIDIAEVWNWIDDNFGHNIPGLCLALETPGKHSPGVNALCSMWDSYGALRALCELKRLRHHRIAPQTWQKTMLPGCEKAQTKPHALAVCRRLWPQESWLTTPKCTRPHEGLIDAALIAEHARRAAL